ncbi:immunity 22 family protein [Acinetobacter pittii]|uniref:immunity 22 family protein n=1 Tax=Acinetobacter pittii TaxID=48296 RepID=UPI001EFCDBC7|nr:immunity 22 family protein [Acinetobacter pittii]MCG9512478.1 immunity 22 family protein [Acinetobacter pittii]
MQQDNYVSIWIGKLDSFHTLENYILNRYSLDGDYEGSIFSSNFDIDFIDDDFIEKDFFNLTDDLNLILEGFSYYERILDEIKLKGVKLPFAVNSIILVYNYIYEEQQKKSGEVEFLCTVPYR